jgi:hypothetical protein
MSAMVRRGREQGSCHAGNVADPQNIANCTGGNALRGSPVTNPIGSLHILNPAVTTQFEASDLPQHTIAVVLPLRRIRTKGSKQMILFCAISF